MTLSGPLFVNRNKSPEAKKRTFFKIFFAVAHLLIETKLFLFLSKFHIFSHLEKSWGGQTKLQFSTKNDATGQKKWLFLEFFFCCTSSRRDETFLFLPKFHIFSRLEKSWGDKKYENFRLKWRRRPKKWLFFGIFFYKYIAKSALH